MQDCGPINNGVTKIVSAMKQKHMEDLLEKARVSVLFSPKQVKDFMYPWQIVTGTNCNRLKKGSNLHTLFRICYYPFILGSAHSQ